MSTNPWLKKNPFLSIWLSTANRMSGSLRGHVTAEVKRQLSSTVTKAIRESLKLATDAVNPAAARTKRRR